MKQTGHTDPMETTYRAWLKHRRMVTSNEAFADSVMSRLQAEARCALPPKQRFSIRLRSARLPQAFTAASASIVGITRIAVFFAILLLPA
ncbi:MAG: hypothetical protein KDN22_32665 [Verrucomicrobiae bacterium]|nr:hypothetical protein [Verrucomicrobiae bacterium]